MSLSTTENEIEVVNVPIIPIISTPHSPTISTSSRRSTPQDSQSVASVPISDPEPSPAASEESVPFSVPPTTPNARFSFSHVIPNIGRPFPKLNAIKLPYIREVGVKTSIDILSNHFSCEDYKLNAVQFWFLDVIVDCLWKLQDEFQFPERYQKIIVGWILHVFDLIRDPQKNLSRKEFFQIFNEALTIADERVQAGCEILPEPDDLFTLVEERGEEEEISFPSESGQSSSVSLATGGESYIAVGIDENTEVFKIPKAPEKCYKLGTPTDQSTTEDLLAQSLCGCEESISFYQPDRNTPDRFRSDSSSSMSSSSSDTNSDIPALRDSRFLWKRSTPPDDTRKICVNDKLVPLEGLLSNTPKQQPEDAIVDEWKDYLEDRKELMYETEMKILINSCALFAIKQFVYDYFHESFQYTIIKLALISTFNSITQFINTGWVIPKILKQELIKPKEKKEKKKKKKPQKKTKKKQKPKKKQKKKKQKPKKTKKPKKPIKKKPTKEEKEELARLKREQEKLEEERRLAEENRRMLFPLSDAADDEFFKSIFEHWVRPKPKKDKKHKGDKKKKKK